MCTLHTDITRPRHTQIQVYNIPTYEGNKDNSVHIIFTGLLRVKRRRDSSLEDWQVSVWPWRPESCALTSISSENWDWQGLPDLRPSSGWTQQTEQTHHYNSEIPLQATGWPLQGIIIIRINYQGDLQHSQGPPSHSSLINFPNLDVVKIY